MSAIPNYLIHKLTNARFAPLLQAKATKEDPSRVLVTGSVAGIAIGSVLNPQSTFSYSASKAAVLHLARNLAVELGPRNILVNGIAPGFFPSKMASGIIASIGGAEELSKKNPNGRLGQPEDIAGIVVFLCSRAAGHVNGDTVVVDGGKMIAGVFYPALFDLYLPSQALTISRFQVVNIEYQFQEALQNKNNSQNIQRPCIRCECWR